jgi:hypothetical protein
MPTPKSKLSKFILSLPATLTGAQIVERAKAKGMKTSGANVYRVRGLFGAKSGKTAAAKVTAASTAKLVAPATPKATPPSKSDFIRSQPATMSAVEVVAKAKADGLKIHVNQVDKVRGRSKAKTVANKVTLPAPKSAAPSKTPTKSKADFVRGFPNLSPKEVVAKAKAEGVKFDVGYVYNVRGSDKSARKKKRAAAKTTTSTSTHTNGVQSLVALSAVSSSAERLLRAVAAEMGLGKAVEILAGERARVQLILKG